MKKIITILLVCFALNIFAVDELYYQITSEIDAYGPIYGEETLNSSRLVSLMFLPLLSVSIGGDTEPILLKGPLPASGTTLADLSVKYSFELKEGILWSNEEELTADDVIFTFKVVKNDATLATNAKDKLREVMSMTKTGRYSFDVVFKHESQDNLGAMFFKILPKSSFPDVDDNYPIIHKSDTFFKKKPITNGLYIARRATGDYTILEYNETYYNPAIVPRIESITVEKVNEEAIIVTNFLGEEDINFLPNMPIGRKDEIDAMVEFGVLQMLDYTWQFLAFNLRNPVLQDLELRKAMTYAFDKSGANSSLYQGYAQEISGPFPPGHQSYNTNVDGNFTPEIDLANEILQKNGYLKPSSNSNRVKDGNELKFRVVIDASREESRNLFNYLMNSFKDAGIELEADYVSNEEYTRKVFEDRDFDMAVVGYSFGSDPNPYTIFHSSTGKIKRGFNVCGLDDHFIDSLLEEANSKKQRAAKIAVYHMIHQEIANLCPGIFLWRRPTFIAYDTDIEGLNLNTIDDLDIFKYIYKW